MLSGVANFPDGLHKRVNERVVYGSASTYVKIKESEMTDRIKKQQLQSGIVHASVHDGKLLSFKAQR